MDVREQIEVLNFHKWSDSLIMPSTFHAALTEKEMPVKMLLNESVDCLSICHVMRW